jgi:hypothetical protein
VIYSLMIDDGDRSASRLAIREKLDEALARPFDPIAAKQYDRDKWAAKNIEAATGQSWADDEEFSQAPALKT